MANAILCKPFQGAIGVSKTMNTPLVIQIKGELITETPAASSQSKLLAQDFAHRSWRELSIFFTILGGRWTERRWSR
jgi:hypothetical protein